MKYGHVSFYNILQINCIRTLTKHLEKCHFNRVSENRMNMNFSTTDGSFVCNCHQFVCWVFFNKDGNAHAISHIIIAVERTQRTLGSRFIWSVCVLAVVPSLGKSFCCLLVDLPLLYANLRCSFSVRADTKYFFEVFHKNYFDWKINT